MATMKTRKSGTTGSMYCQIGYGGAGTPRMTPTRHFLPRFVWRLLVMPFKVAAAAAGLVRRIWLRNQLKWVKDQVADEELRDKNHARYMRALLAEQYRLEGLLKVKGKTLHYSLSGWRREEESTQ